MDKIERKKIKLHQEKRRLKKIRLGITSLILLIIGVYSVVTYYRLNKNEYNKYTENAKADYKVKLKENEFYTSEYLDNKNTLIASLIDNIDINLNYSLNIENKQDYDYSYKVIAKTNVKETARASSIYETTDELIVKETQEMKESDGFTISENVTINYNDYNEKINKFINVYNLDNTTSTLDLEMYVYIINKYDGKQINKDSKVMTLSIPLTTKTVDVGISSNVIKDSGDILIKKSEYENIEYILYVGIALTILGAIIFIKFIKYIIDTRSAETMYKQELKRILFNYKSYIQQTNNVVNQDEYKIITINSFNEILGLRDTIQSPILMHTEENEEKTKFMIISEGIIYIYVLGAKEIREELKAKSMQKKNK